ncbi:MAG: DUF7662 domain-containing protein [Pseudohongiellaceae bacterium]
MSKYDPLQQHLAGCKQSRITLSFVEIEKIINAKLPPSARSHQAWWANNPNGHSHCRAWVKVGWYTSNLRISTGQIDFIRQQISATNRATDQVRKRPASKSGRWESKSDMYRHYTKMTDPPTDYIQRKNVQEEFGLKKIDPANYPSYYRSEKKKKGRAATSPALYGSLAGTVTIHDPAALTAPSGERWAAEGEQS